MNIKMVINSTYDYCALYVRTMYVIMAAGTFPIQSNLLMHSIIINKMRLSGHSSLSVNNTREPFYLYLLC